MDIRKNSHITTLDFSNNLNMSYLFATDDPALKTIYIQEDASYTVLEYDEDTATVYLKASSDYDEVGGGDNWGDEDINPWN